MWQGPAIPDSMTAEMKASTSSCVLGGCRPCSSTGTVSRRPPSLQARRQTWLAGAHAWRASGSSPRNSNSTA
eukprot:14549975-Alexandrium_andersonii.AAC.1